MSTLPDLYEVLDVPRSATTEEIRRAFRKLVRRYHPDTSGIHHPAYTDTFAEVIAAYGVLHDPLRRRIYDSELKQRTKQAEHPSFRQPSVFNQVKHRQVTRDREMGVFAAFMNNSRCNFFVLSAWHKLKPDRYRIQITLIIDELSWNCRRRSIGSVLAFIVLITLVIAACLAADALASLAWPY